MVVGTAEELNLNSRRRVLKMCSIMARPPLECMMQVGEAIAGSWKVREKIGKKKRNAKKRMQEKNEEERRMENGE